MLLEAGQTIRKALEMRYLPYLQSVCMVWRVNEWEGYRKEMRMRGSTICIYAVACAATMTCWSTEGLRHRKQVLDLDTATRLSELSFLPILTIASRISY